MANYSSKAQNLGDAGSVELFSVSSNLKPDETARRVAIYRSYVAGNYIFTENSPAPGYTFTSIVGYR
jgi:hypothetical protein